MREELLAGDVPEPREEIEKYLHRYHQTTLVPLQGYGPSIEYRFAKY